MPELKSIRFRRVTANLVFALLFLLMFLSSGQMLANVLVIGEVKMDGISALGAKCYRFVCVVGIVLSLVNYRSAQFPGGAALGIAVLMGLGIRQDLNDLAEFYPDKIVEITDSVKLTGWGWVMVISTVGMLLLSAAGSLLGLRPKELHLV